MTHGSRSWKVAAVALAAAIVVAGVLPTRETVHAVAEGHDDLLTSAGHFIEFAVFAFVLAVAFDEWRVSLRSLLGSLVLAACLGIVVEVIQAPLPYRDAQVSDAVVDVAGAVLGLAAFSAAAAARATRRPWRRG